MPRDSEEGTPRKSGKELLIEKNDRTSLISFALEF